MKFSLVKAAIEKLSEINWLTWMTIALMMLHDVSLVCSVLLSGKGKKNMVPIHTVR